MRLILIFSTLHFLAFIDRTMIGGLLPLMRANIPMSDVQAGWIIGTAFALPYGATALAMAAQLRGRRSVSVRWLIAGVLVWTVGCLATGLAGSFTELTVARIALGVGQGIFVPLGISLLFDHAVAAKRGKALGLFMGSATVGRSTALLAAGVGLWAFSHLAQTNDAQSWRWLFVFTALPNLIVLVALVVMWGPGTDPEGISTSPAVDWMALSPRFLVAVAPVILAQSVLGWLPSLFVSERGLSPTDAALLIGTITLFAAPSGPLLAGWLASRYRASERHAPMLVLVALSATVMPLAGLVLASGMVMAISSMTIMLVTLGIASFFGLFGVQLAIPAVARVGVNGVYFAFITLVGLGLGPLVTGALKSVAIGGMPLGHALVVTALITVAVCAAAVAATRLVDRRQPAS